ncbi:hypothetical protein E1165_12180 [Micromonospora sp. KC723]|nr:hypothetical protein E1165_12180 [Micromonospora sp. KC723]
MNRPVHRRVIGSDQDRSRAVTRVAASRVVAMMRCLVAEEVSPDPPARSWCLPVDHERGADSKRGPSFQLVLRHS